MSQTATQPAGTPKFVRTKGAVGRPSKFYRERIDEAIELCRMGATDRELCDKFGINQATLYRWKNGNPEFRDAITSAKTLCDHRVERTLFQKALGYDVRETQAVKVKTGQYEEEVEVVEVERHIPASDTAAIFWLKNRDPNRWRDKQDIDLNANVLVADVSSRDTALAMIQLLRTAGVDADESQPATIDHEPAQSAPAASPVAPERRRRAFG